MDRETEAAQQEQREVFAGNSLDLAPLEHRGERREQTGGKRHSVKGYDERRHALLFEFLYEDGREGERKDGEAHA
jgi:hypothetical protein